MTLAILIFVFLVIALFGLYMVNKVGNYENIWGACLFGGCAITVILSVVSVIIFFLGLL